LRATCIYCNTVSVISNDIAKESSKLLAQESASYRARAGGVATNMARTSINMSRIVTVCVVLTYVGVIAFAALVQSALK
jgi:hypothetical protein